ncbi:MAG: EsaB/YukD family protein, partial [Pseudonocardia sp.]|nr:EsaB/YukD family protein [Pseudonocardia sp.]
MPEPQLTPATGPAPTGLWARVGVLTPLGRVDLALPADVPVAELVPMVQELIAQRSARGTRICTAMRGGNRGVPQPWRFSGPAGGPLPVEATLAGLGVLDGELLHLGPHRAPLPLPVFDDPADALAASVRESGGGDPAARWAGPLAALAVVTAASAVLATVRGVPGVPVAAVVAAVAVAV